MSRTEEMGSEVDPRRRGGDASRALILGCGGLAGIAWEVGLLAGLKSAGIDITADFIVGTSAGANVGAEVANDRDVDDLFAAQSAPSEETAERSMEFNFVAMAELRSELMANASSAREVRMRFGAMAMSATTPSAEERRGIISNRLTTHVWPSRKFAVVAVNAASGEWRTFDAGSGVSLIDAVAASSALPGVWPPVEVDGTYYIDGGVRSVTNADLALGYDRILIVAPMVVSWDSPYLRRIEKEIDILGAASNTILIVPDEASVEAFGTNPLDVSTRAKSAIAGRDQGRLMADDIGSEWLAV